MRKLLSVMMVIAFTASMAFAQGETGWYHEETVLDFAHDDSSLVGGTGSVTGDWYKSGSPHGVVVDAEGKIWVAMHDGYGPNQDGSPEFLWDDVDDYDDDGVTTDDTSYYKPLYVFNSDGTPASFSPITELTIGGETDILHAYSPINGSGKGITIDNDGNILYSSWSTVYRINYETGEGMAKYVPSDIGLGSITEAVQDPVTGNVFMTWVIGGSKPIVMLDSDLNYLGNAADTLGYITRSLAVRSNDDNSSDIFTGTTWSGNGIIQWHSPDQLLDPFTQVDTVGNLDEFQHGDSLYTNVKLWSSSIDWTPDGNILAGALRFAPGWAGPTGSQWHIIDPETDEYLYTFGYPVPNAQGDNPSGYETVPGGANGPRGGYFVDGNTLYTVDFYLFTVDKWYFDATGVEGEKGLPSDFALNQNYPNPFNPTTSIPFRLDESGQVELTIYDMRGSKVATLLNRHMDAGNHTYSFDGTGLPSGTYIYQINFNGQMRAKQMVLVK